MKILLLIRSLDPGGAERQVLELAKGLVARGAEAHIAVFYSGGRLEDELFGISDITLHDLQKGGRWRVASLILNFRNLICNQKFDVVYGFLSTGNLLALFSRIFRNSARIWWGIRDSNTDYSVYDPLIQILSTLQVLLSPFADKIIINSYAGYSDYLRKGFFKKKMHIIRNGVDTNYFKSNHVVRAEMRNRLGFSNDTILIGNVARLHPKKDHAMFLHAARLLKAKKKNIHFLCTGGHSFMCNQYAEELKKLCNNLELNDVVHWLGDRQDIPNFLNAIDIFTWTSRFGEGFPNVIAEAMACEVPCVVTDCGDSKLIVGDLFRTVGVSDPGSLLEGWMYLLEMGEEERRQLGVLARDRIMRIFSIDSMVEKTLSLLKNL